VALFKRAEIAIEGGRAVQRQNKPFKYGERLLIIVLIRLLS
jgi:hypothetical protein